MIARLLVFTAVTRQPNSPGFDLLLLAHIVVVLGGLAAVVVSGAQAGRLIACGDAQPPGNLRRYYEPGTNWVGRILYAVPVLGFVLIADSGGAFKVTDGWVVMGLGIWVVVAMVGEGVLWPAERRVQQLVAAGPAPEAAGRAQECWKILVAAAVMAVLVVVACGIMVARP